MMTPLVIVYVLMMVCALNMHTCDAKRKSIYDTQGVVLVDSLSFPKIVPHSVNNVLLLISNKYNVGKEVTDAIRDDYFDFAANCVEQGVSNLLLAQMLVNGAENAALAGRLGVTDPMTFKNPKLVLFKAGSKDPITYPDSGSFSVAALRKFVSENTAVTFAAPGLSASLTQFVKRFVDSSDTESRTVVHTELTQVLTTLTAEEATVGAAVSKVMSKIIAGGFEYVSSESKRVSNLLANPSLAPEKKAELRNKLALLKEFALPVGTI